MSNEELIFKNNFVKVANLYIKDNSPEVYKKEYKNYVINFLVDFYDYYNKDNYFYEIKESPEFINTEFIILFKNKETNLYCENTYYIRPDLFNSFLSRLLNILDNSLQRKPGGNWSSFSTNSDNYEEKIMIEFINYKATQIEKEEILNKLKLEKEKDNFYIGIHTEPYNRINSGNFTDYELSTMYDEETIKKYKSKNIEIFKRRI